MIIVRVCLFDSFSACDISRSRSPSSALHRAAPAAQTVTQSERKEDGMAWLARAVAHFTAERTLSLTPVESLMKPS